jgi:hypothetical protein
LPIASNLLGQGKPGPYGTRFEGKGCGRDSWQDYQAFIRIFHQRFAGANFGKHYGAEAR